MTSGPKDRCAKSGKDDDLVLQEFSLTLSLEGFSIGPSTGFMSFQDVLISFEADLKFEVTYAK